MLEKKNECRDVSNSCAQRKLSFDERSGRHMAVLSNAGSERQKRKRKEMRKRERERKREGKTEKQGEWVRYKVTDEQQRQ